MQGLRVWVDRVRLKGLGSQGSGVEGLGFRVFRS